MQTAENKPTHDAWGTAIWYPEDKPYRVRPVYRSNAPLMYGWREGKVETFATEAEARARLSEIHGAWYVELHVAENAATWRRNGKWKLVATTKKPKRAKQ